MKKITKLITTFFVALLTIGSVPVHAEEVSYTQTVTVKNTVAGKSYTAYPLLRTNGTTSSSSGNSAQYYIYSTDNFYSAISNYSGFDLIQDASDSTMYYVNKNSNFSSVSLVSTIKSFLNSNDTSSFKQATGTANADNENVVLTFENMDSKGYFFYVSTTSGSLVSTATSSSNYIQNVDVYDKNKEMEIQKVDDAKEANDGYKTANVGDVINYTVSADLPYESIDDYLGNYIWKVSDTMSSGLKFNDDLTAYILDDSDNEYLIYVNGNISDDFKSAGVKAGTYDDVYKYYLSDTQPFASEIEVTTSDQGWTFDIHDLYQKGQSTSITSDGGGDTDNSIKVTGYYRLIFKYSATVTDSEISSSGAMSYATTIKNTAALEHSTTPDNPETTEKKEETTYLYVTSLGIMKIDSEHINTATNDVLDQDGFLSGAEFVLQNSDGKYFLKDDAGNVTWTSEIALATKAVSDASNYGKCSFDGIEVGSYKIIETKAPDGYNMLKLPVEINLKISNSGLITRIEDDSYNYSAGYSNYVKIANSKGIILPETGEKGGMILTIVGCLTAIGAVIYCVKKKK